MSTPASTAEDIADMKSKPVEDYISVFDVSRSEDDVNVHYRNIFKSIIVAFKEKLRGKM